MAIRTQRQDDLIEGEPGLRVLVCRYRPRGLKKEFETWDLWYPELGPGVALHAAAYGKQGLKIGWDTYRRLYLREMQQPAPGARITELAAKLSLGQTITLLCSSACVRESRCHRSLLAELITATANDQVTRASVPDG